MKTQFLFILLVFAGSLIAAQTYQVANLQNQIKLEKLTREFVNSEWEYPDLEKVKTYFRPDATFLLPSEEGNPQTFEKYINWRARQLQVAKPKVEIQDVHVVGNETMVFASWTGTIIQNRGKPEGVEKVTKASFVYSFFWEHEKIKRMEMYWDSKKIDQDWGNNP